MLSWILGIEDSFIKSLYYVIILASLIVMGGSLIYLIMVGLPMYLVKNSENAPTSETND